MVNTLLGHGTPGRKREGMGEPPPLVNHPSKSIGYVEFVEVEGGKWTESTQNQQIWYWSFVLGPGHGLHRQRHRGLPASRAWNTGLTQSVVIRNLVIK